MPPPPPFPSTLKETVEWLDSKRLKLHESACALSLCLRQCAAYCNLKDTLRIHGIRESLVAELSESRRACDRVRLFIGRCRCQTAIELQESNWKNHLLTACLIAFLLAWGSTGLAEQSNTVTELPVSKQLQAPPGIRVEAQWWINRAGFYPLIETYFSNDTAQSVELKNPRLNGLLMGHLTNGVVWSDFYPCDRIEPGQTIALMSCLARVDEGKPQTVTVETRDGQKIECQLGQLSKPGPVNTPKRRIQAVTFSRRFDRMFVTYAGLLSAPLEEPSPQITVNNKDCIKQMKVLQVPMERQPGLLIIKLPSPAGPGKPVHIRLQFPDGEVAQTLLRAARGCFLDDFTVPETDEVLRRSLNLDLHPYARLIGADPACADLENRRTFGGSAAQILATRRDWYKKFPEILSYDYLCTAATVNRGYPIYGKIADGIQINPYELHYSSDPKPVESEETYFEAGRESARAGLWFWIPEAFCRADFPRILEPAEARLLAWGAIGQACKGLRYYSHTEKSPLIGYSKSPALLKEIIRLNADIRSLEPVLAASIHLEWGRVGDRQTGYRVYTLWTPDASSDADIAVVVRNVDYQTDRQSNELGAKPRCHVTPKKNLHVRVSKPSWLTVESVTDGLTRQPVAIKQMDEAIELDVGDLELGKILWIKNSNKEFKHELAQSVP